MDESHTSPESNRGYKREVNMSNHINIKSLEEILELLNGIEYVEDADAFEYLSGIRDQAARIMRDTIQWVEEDVV
jgi:DNA-binding transcriptional regulator WhiA